MQNIKRRDHAITMLVHDWLTLPRSRGGVGLSKTTHTESVHTTTVFGQRPASTPSPAAQNEAVEPHRKAFIARKVGGVMY